MALDTLQHAEIIRELEIFMDKRRPPEHIRDQLDLIYEIDQQSVVLMTVRPRYHQPN